MASASNDFRISRPKLEIGPIKTDFEVPDYATQLARAQRYYQEQTNSLIALIVISDLNPSWLFPVEMRAAPTMTATPSAGSGMTLSATKEGIFQDTLNSVSSLFSHTANARLI